MEVSEGKKDWFTDHGLSAKQMGGLSLMSLTETMRWMVLERGGPGGLKLAVTVTVMIGFSLSGAESLSILFAMVTNPVSTHK